MPEVYKISVSITRQQFDFLKLAVDAGEYASISEILREAIRLWHYEYEARMAEKKRKQYIWEQMISKNRSRKPKKRRGRR